MNEERKKALRFMYDVKRLVVIISEADRLAKRIGAYNFDENCGTPQVHMGSKEFRKMKRLLGIGPGELSWNEAFIRETVSVNGVNFFHLMLAGGGDND